MHSTNYANTFIEVADDCKVESGTIPPERGKKTVARMQYEMIHEHAYRYASDDVIFGIYAVRNGIDEADLDAKRAEFFAKGRACLRSSPLAKQYGWGIHHDGDSKVALYPRESVEYEHLKDDPALKHVKAMRSSR